MKKNDVIRLTADLPTHVHTKLKAVAAINNKCMRDVLVDLIEQHLNIDDIRILLKK